MKNKQTNELAVCGLKAVLQLAETNPDKITRLFFNEAVSPLFGKICKILSQDRRLYRLVPDDDLEKLSKSKHHQGVVAMIDLVDPAIVDESVIQALAKAKEPFFVLDQVGNSNNLGAITRACAFFGLKTIILSDSENQALITTSAYRVAEGGMEFVTFYHAPNLADFMRRTRKDAFYLGADHRGKTEVTELKPLMTGDRALAIVLGNEENGLSSLVRKSCDGFVRVPGQGNIESLNVSMASGIILSHLFS